MSNKLASSELLMSIISDSCQHAERLLAFGELSPEAIIRRASGLELSPLLDKQMTAVALRIGSELCLSDGITEFVTKHFRSTIQVIVVDNQRRAIEREVQRKSLPMELASDYAYSLERKIDIGIDQLPEILWSFAEIYDDIWCDPRIHARIPTRRIMLAMKTVLHGRSAKLTVGRNSIRPAS